MSTTRDDLISRDGFRYNWVLAIEGYEYLITDGDTAAAIAAWAGTPWSSALSGMSVETNMDQSMEPFDPFSTSRSVSFSVMNTGSSDQFGVDVSRPAIGAKTWLSAACDSNDTTISAKDTSAFSASGTIYIGNERISYTGKTATSFTGCTRGVYSPFRRNGISAYEFGKPHDLPVFDNQVQILPLITQYPPTFIGRWVGLWMHRTRGGVWDTKAEAHLVYAGKISDVRDTSNGTTTVACTDLIDIAKESTLMSLPFEARIREGVDLSSFDKFNVSVIINGIGRYEHQLIFTPGLYTIDSLISTINAHMATLPTVRASANMGIRVIDTEGGSRVEVSAKETTAGNLTAAFLITASKRVLQFLGLSNFDNQTGNSAQAAYSGWQIDIITGNETYYKKGDHEPLRLADAGVHSRYTTTLASELASVYVDGTTGVFVDQQNTLPQSVQTALQQTGSWAIFILAGVYMVGKWDSANSKISNLFRIKGFMKTKASEAQEQMLSAGRLAYSAKPEDFTIRQVVILEGNMRDLVVRALCGTSVAGYNHATHDADGGSLGAGIPYELIASLYESLSRVDGESGGNGSILVLERPTTIREAFSADLILRQAFVHWFNGSLRVAQWSVPRASKAIAHLTESNKAGALGDVQRTPSERTDRHMRNVIKIEYNRVPGSDKYESDFSFVDAASIQTYGIERSVTIKARNSYGDYATTGDSVKSLAPNILSVLPVFSRPRFECRRTINQTMYEALHLGAVVKVSDNFMRDPSTGIRGVVERSGIVVGISYDFGGRELTGDVRSAVGEVVVLMSDEDDGKDLCPGMMVDYTFNTGGYTGGYDGSQTLKIIPKSFAASSSADDIAAFSVGDEVTIVEVNPNDPAFAIQIDATISAIGAPYAAFDVPLGAAGFVTGREYKIIPRGYYACTAPQKGKYTFLADENHLVDSTRSAYTFGEDDDRPESLSLSSAVAYQAGGKIAESNEPDADGPPMDVATIHEMSAAINHLIDSRLSPIASCISGREAVGRSMYMVPVFIGRGTVAGSMRRNLKVKLSHRNFIGTVSYTMVAILSSSPPLTRVADSSSYGTGLVDDLQYDGRIATDTVTASFTMSPTTTTFDLEINRMLDSGLYWLIVGPGDNAAAFNIYMNGITEIHLEERAGI
jgi:hypothetical protein